MRLVAIAGLFALVAGCSHGQQTEVGTPAQAYNGRALVIVPRACITDHAEDVHPGEKVIPRHAAETIPPATTARLQALLDGIGPEKPLAVGPRPNGACEVPVDSDLADVRATSETMSALRQRGANYAVVLEVHTELGCSVSEPWSAHDTCSEDEVTIAAWMFDANGAAIWSLTRHVLPTDEPTAAIDRVLARVPVTERLRRTRGEWEIGRATPTGPVIFASRSRAQ